jgi:MSHA biogenesis protein MshL
MAIDRETDQKANGLLGSPSLPAPGWNMERRIRNWLGYSALILVMVLTASTPVAARGGAADPGQAPVPLPPAGQQPAPPTRLGMDLPGPGLSPLAVSQIEEGRRSDGMDQTLSPGLPAGPPPVLPTRRGMDPQSPGLSPLAVSQIEEGRRSDAMDQTLSLSLAEPVTIHELLLLLVRDTNLSVVPDPDVEGTFSGELKNVTLRQALGLILEPHGMSFTCHDNVLRVTRRQMQTRLFNINYVATRRSGTHSTGLAGGVGTGGYGAGGTVGFSAGINSAGFGGGSYPGTGGFGGGRASVSGTDVGDVFEELQAGVQTLISEFGRSNMDRKAGLLQVTDFPDRLDKIALYVEAYENRALRQVRIVAKIIEVELREDFSAGIDWSLVLRNAGNSVSLTQRQAPTRGSSAFTMGVDIKDFKGFLDAFASQGRVNVMASPWVTAMNNEPAVMRVGTQDVFFVTTSQVDATSGQILQTVVTPQAVTEGIVLSVTPQIAADGIIHMSVMPSITERTGTATSRLGDQVPIVSVRETDTLVRVQEGETIVIAGLMQERTTVEKTKVPVRGDVPGAGGPFRREDRQKRKTDLIILLTPTVMTPGEIAATAASDEQRLYQEPRAPVRK